MHHFDRMALNLRLLEPEKGAAGIVEQRTHLRLLARRQWTSPQKPEEPTGQVGRRLEDWISQDG